MTDDRTDTHPAAPVHFEHWCEHPECKRWGSFGHSARKDEPPRWFCMEHRPDREAPTVQ